jgi:HEAT repeat protein/TolA-binding protein
MMRPWMRMVVWIAALGAAAPVHGQTSEVQRGEVRRQVVEALEQVRVSLDVARSELSEQVHASVVEAAAQVLAMKDDIAAITAEAIDATFLSIDPVLGARDPAPTASAPAPWLQVDPADSLYRVGRDALNRRDFERAASVFAEIRSRHPSSGYAPDSYYFQAFALQRLGGRARGQEALRLIEEQRNRHPDAATRADADQLRVRLQGVLAQAGDPRATVAIEQQALSGCDQEDQQLRVAALSALMSMDEARALPILQEILRSRDECSVELRRQAVFLVARTEGEGVVDLLLDLAQRDPDPDPEVRQQAVFWLSRVRTDAAVDALEAILQQSTDRRLQEQAVFALSQQGSPRTLQILRGYAERSGTPSAVRQQAIHALSRTEGGSAYLRQLYPTLAESELKQQAIFAVAQSGTAEDRAWLLERVRDSGEDTEVRKHAIAGVSRAGLPLADVRALYSEIDERDVREQLIFAISRSDDPEAVDALMEIARGETDRRLREQAVFWLGRMDDERAAQFLLDLIRGR